MKYMGSKGRHAREILPLILRSRMDGQPYVEPFVGGFNVIDKVEGIRFGNDNHPYLISLFKAVQNGWEPPTSVSEQEYADVQRNKDKYPEYLVGFVGFGCSYSGKWFGGFARGNDNKGNPRNYCLESRTNILKQAPNLEGIQITCLDYRDLVIPEKSIIYCDPPYAQTTAYATGTFDTKYFWNWVRKQSENGHTLFVSEYVAPPDFKCVWEKHVNNTLVANTGAKTGVEKLFTLNDL